MAMSTVLMECAPEPAHEAEMREAEMTVMGPVGPLICDGVPPKREAKNPNIMAPINPANAPMAPMLATS